MRRASSVLRRFWAVLDSESVRLFQGVMYFYFTLAGIYLLLSPGPRSEVLEQMGPLAHQVWSVLMLAAPLVVLVGHFLPNRWSGLVIEISGDACILLLLVTFAVATIQSSWGKGVFSLWTTLGLATCVALIILRNARQLVQIEQIAKELRR